MSLFKNKIVSSTRQPFRIHYIGTKALLNLKKKMSATSVSWPVLKRRWWKYPKRTRNEQRGMNILGHRAIMSPEKNKRQSTGRSVHYPRQSMHSISALPSSSLTWRAKSTTLSQRSCLIIQREIWQSIVTFTKIMVTIPSTVGLCKPKLQSCWRKNIHKSFLMLKEERFMGSIMSPRNVESCSRLKTHHHHYPFERPSVSL